ncbi:hypothetical protein [Burkholderia vietnamiensis]|uniref:hypothetical protein n=1 Tax=Burkholderia vietnamiensis TaxID=60552 RepID=UPI0018C50CB2|nr:hypothetical protein [Burkholderia vietnamiensis]
MNLKALVADRRTSIKGDAVDARLFSSNLRHLKDYSFWDGHEGTPRLWEHQQAAIATVVAYLCGEKTIPENPEHKEAALLKLPTGTGKSGIIAVVSRCLPCSGQLIPDTALSFSSATAGASPSLN